MPLVRAATYQRRLPTSTEWVWENVHDWEHLPWLHRSSFSSIALLDSGSWGWKARIGLQPQGEGKGKGKGKEIVVELRVEDAEARYVARTLEGALQGAEVWTDVEAQSDAVTDVAVEFWVPDADPAAIEAMGRAYLELYRQLWDEDESMMVRRSTEVAALASARDDRARLRLGSLDELRRRLPWKGRWAGRPVRVVEHKGELLVHATRCPHSLGPLEHAELDEDGCIECPWHGYRFNVREGRSADGRGFRLDRAPALRVDDDGSVWLESSRGGTP